MEELEIVKYQHMDLIRVLVDSMVYRRAHFHSEWELLWLLEGDLQIRSGQTQLTARAGDVLVFSPNQLHEMQSLSGGSIFLCIQFSHELFHMSRFIRVPEVRLGDTMGREDLLWVKKTMLDMAFPYFGQEAYSDLLCMSQSGLLLHRILSSVPNEVLTTADAAAADRNNARLERLQSFVLENYRHKIRLTDFAQAEGCSMGYLSHFIKEQLGQTFQEYVNIIRFRAACGLLAAGGLSMQEVAREAGFSDYRYFVSAFRKYGGDPGGFHAAPLPEKKSPAKTPPTQERLLNRSESLHMLQRFRKQYESELAQ